MPIGGIKKWLTGKEKFVAKRKKEELTKNKGKRGKKISNQKLRDLLGKMFFAFPDTQLLLWDSLKNLATNPQSVPGLIRKITENPTPTMIHPIFWLVLLVHQGTVNKDRSPEGEEVAKFLRQISGMIRRFIFSFCNSSRTTVASSQ